MKFETPRFGGAFFCTHAGAEQWKFRQLDMEIAASQAVLTPLEMKVVAKQGFFSGRWLPRSMSDKNPDSQRLQDVRNLRKRSMPWRAMTM